MKTILAILFLFDGDPTFVEGLFPLEFETEAQCEVGRTKAQELFDNPNMLPPGAEKVFVFCADHDGIQQKIDKLNEEKKYSTV